MVRHFCRWLAAIVVALGASGQVTPLHALDSRYKDADGDLVADVPADPKDQIDPAVLLFATRPRSRL